MRKEMSSNNLNILPNSSASAKDRNVSSGQLNATVDTGLSEFESLHNITETSSSSTAGPGSSEVLYDILSENNYSEITNNDECYENLVTDEKWRDLIEIDEEHREFDDLPPHENEQIDDDSCNENFQNDTPIYPGHFMTVHNSMLLILFYTISHSISGAQLSDLLTLISVHCLHSHPGLQSIYMFKKYFATMNSPLKKHFYCCYCLSSVNENTETCPSNDCGKKITGSKNKSYFIEIPLEEQIEKIMKRSNILKSVQARFSRKKKKEDGIEDIYDGNIYKNMSASGGPLSEDNPNNISFTWNTDGIPVFKSSKFSLWPFYLIINELPFKERIKKENMILCGLWFGESKPFMSLFTKPLMKSLKNLETNGIEYEVEGNAVLTKAFLICGTADLPAKSIVLNCNQFNGQYSCMRCQHPGETYKTQAGGSVHVFPYDISKANYEERTTESCVQDAFRAIESCKTTKGIKGPSFLMTLKSYDFVKSSSIDYMHGVLLGIGKLLTKLWISSSYSKENFSISMYVDIIDERLLQIKPPSIITRVPRSLSQHFKYWKASELRSWLLFYSLPILCDILPEEYFMHYACLVQGIYLLSSECITAMDIKKSKDLLSYFVHMFPTLYGERYVTLNMHSLLHIPQCVEDLGPLWVYSCFPFESINGVLMELFHGTQNIELQIMYSINTVQNMSSMLEDIKDERLLMFANKLSHGHTAPRTLIGTSSACIPIGASSKIIMSDILYDKLVSEVNFLPNKILSYKRIMLRGKTLHSVNYTRVQVRNTYTVKYFDSVKQQFRYGFADYYILAKKCECIKEICLCSSTLVAVIHELKSTTESIVNPNFLGVDVPHIKIVEKTGNVLIVDVTKIINVVVFVNFSSDKGTFFVCDFPNVAESD